MDRTSVVAVLTVAALVTVAVLVLRAVGILQGPELVVYDRFLSWEVARRSDGGHSPVVLIEIDETDIREQGHWPISDRVMAEALLELSRRGARVIGLDLYRDLPVPPGSEMFERVLREQRQIIAVRKFGDLGEDGIPGPSVLDGTQRVGFNDIVFDPDETVRRGLLFQDDGGGEVESAFSLRIALAALAADGIGPQPDPERPEWLRLGATTLRPLERSDGGYSHLDAAGYQYLLDYAAAGRGFETYRLGELLRGEVTSLRDRVVLVGSNAKSLPDLFEVPTGGQVAGVALHAHMVDQLLRQARGVTTPRRHLEEWGEWTLLFLVALLGCAAGVRAGESPVLGTSGPVVTVLGGAAGLVLAGWLLFVAGWWLPVVAPSLAWMSSAGVVTAWVSSRERAQRSQLMGLFARHVSAEVADEIWRHRDEFLREGRPRPQRLTASVLFVDMKGYSAQAEKMDPADLMDWVNEFMESMAHQVEAHGGFVDDYFGDGIKANFGVPIPRRTNEQIADDAKGAVRCALAMSQALGELNERYRERDLPGCAMRIGIDTGQVVAGSLGSAQKLKYTVVGDVAVTAQRLESTSAVEHDFDRSSCRILVAATTHELIGEDFWTQSAGSVVLKGKDEPVQVFRVLGMRPSA